MPFQPPAPPVPALPEPATSSAPVASPSGKGWRGRIISLGVPRTEVVSLRVGDALAKLAGQLAVLVVMVMLARIFFWMLVVVVLLMIVFRPLRWLLSPALQVGGMMRGRGGGQQLNRLDVEVPVTSFTLNDSSGKLHEVVLRGELRGGSPHLGDEVEVVGRVGRNGEIRAKAVKNLATRATVSTRLHPAEGRARLQVVMGVIAIPLLAFMAYALVTTFFE